MVNARNFYLANKDVFGSNKENEPYYDFQKKGVLTFFNLPEGLGSEYTNQFFSYGDYKELISQNTNEPVISGEVIFKGASNPETYDLYYEFAQYLEKGNLVFVQEQPSVKRNTTFYTWNGAVYGMKVAVNKLEKSEIDQKTGALRCKVEFLGYDYWRTDYTFFTQAAGSYSFDAEIVDGGSTIVKINNPTSKWQKINISILPNAAFTDVRYTLAQNNQQLGKGRLKGQSFKQIIIKSIGRDNIDIAPGTSFPYANFVDWTYAIKGVPFIFLSVPPGQSQLSVAFVSENTMSGKVRVTMEEKYDTV